MDFPALDGLQVLVVDDAPDTRALFTFVLMEKGAKVREAASAEAALAAMQVMPFDLLITDIRMPDMDGFEFLHQVRLLPDVANAQIPAIVITSFADEETQLQILAAGVQRILMKPTDIEHFVATVAELIGERSQVTSH